MICLAIQDPFFLPSERFAIVDSRGPQGRITTVVFQFGLGDDWLKGAKMVRELEGTISTPQVGSLELKKLKELVDVVNHVK